MTDKNSLIFNTGEFVIYKTYGLCTIDNIIEKDFGIGAKSYYILNQVNQPKATFYVPCEMYKSIRLTLSKDEIDTSIKESNQLDIIWEQDNKKRYQILDDIILNGTMTQKLTIFKILLRKKDESIANKKRMYICDEKALTTLEKLICEEFSYVLNIEKSQIIQYIFS